MAPLYCIGKLRSRPIAIENPQRNALYSGVLDRVIINSDPPIGRCTGGSEFYSSPSVLRNKKHLLKKLGYLSGFFELISLEVRSKVTILWLWILVKQS